MNLLRFLQRPRNRRKDGARARTRLAVNVPASRKEVRQRREARTRKLIRWSAIGAGVAVLGLYARSLWKESFRGNPDFSVGQFEYHSNGGIPAREAAAAAGLRADMNLMEVDLSDIRTRLMALPRVRQVSVERRLPDKLAITLEERLPVARIISVVPDRPNNILPAHCLFLDAQGVALKCEEHLREYIALPTINAVDQTVITVGREVPSHTVKAALTLLELLRTRDWPVPCNPERIEIPNDWTLAAEMESGAVFTFQPEKLARQLDRLEFILTKTRAARRSVQTVNLQLARNVPVRFFDQIAAAAERPAPGTAVPLAAPQNVSFSNTAPTAPRAARPAPAGRQQHDIQTILRGN